MIPPMSSCSTRWTRRMPRSPRTRAHSIRRAGADDEDVVVGVRGLLELLGMPAAPVLLAGGRVLRADDRRASDLPGDADVAADALADVVEPALVDLLREERVEMDGRQVAMMSSASLIASTMRSGLVKRPTPSTGFFETPFTAFCRGDGRTRRSGTASHPRPEMPETLMSQTSTMSSTSSTKEAVALELRAGLAHEHVGRHADGDGAVVADCVAHLLDRLAPETRAVLEGAAYSSVRRL